MPSNQTPNYALSQWERDDRILMEDFNADNAKIDAALGAHAVLLAGLEARKGNCQVEVFSYTGKSQDGHDLTNSFTFSKRPAFVLIFGGRSIFLMPGQSETGIFIGTYEALNGNRTLMDYHFQWSGNTATITSTYRQIRMDAMNIKYHAIAWISVDDEA